MLKLLKTIFNGSAEKKAGNNSADSESVETKKCLHCLRRVNINYLKCPHCKTENFQY